MGENGLLHYGKDLIGPFKSSISIFFVKMSLSAYFNDIGIAV
jgi:hypothetical protein